MMLRALVVAALLALAVPADARALTDERDAGLSVAFPMGNPTLRADPAVWLDALRSDGYSAAARASDPHSQAQAQAQDEEEPETEDEESPVEHFFMPLGDANGNGRDDIVLATIEDETMKLEALDGGRVGEVLWTLELGEEEYAYIAGDVDEDGVYDLEQMVDSEASESGSDSGMQWEQRANINILSGRDLALLTSLQVVASNEYEETHPEPLPIGQSTWRESFTYEFVIDIEGLPGLARLAYNFEYYESEERIVVVTTEQSSSMNYSTSFALLDPSGALVWAFDEKGFEVDYAFNDATGDEVPDVLVRSNDQYSSSYSGMGPGIEPPIPVPILTQEAAERPPYLLRLLNGANGEQVWERSLGNATFSFTEWLGDLYGNGDVLAVYIFDFDQEDFEFSERLAFLDGDTGETLQEFTTLESFAPLGDANGDGRDDLLQLDFNDSTLGFKALDGDLNELWSAKLKDDDFAGIVDLTSDSVLDIITQSGDNVTVLSGTDGKESWTREDSRLYGFDVTAGIVDEADHEVALVLSDAKDHEDVTDYPVDLLILRGSDGAPLWKKPLYDPTDYTDVAGDDAGLWVGAAGDLNGDGAQDFIVDFEQWYMITISTTCVNDECETETTDSREDDEGQPLNIVALVDGATGATITRFDDMELSGKAKKADKVVEDSVDVKPAAEDLVQEDAPGFAFFMALAAVGVALIVRRRKA